FAADSSVNRCLANVCRGPLFIGCCLRSDHRTALRLAPGALLPEQIAQRRPCRVITAHAMHATTGRRGGGAQIDAPDRRPIWMRTQHRAREELPQSGGACVDVAAD